MALNLKKGGLLALLPSDEDKYGQESEWGIFGQWLHYTHRFLVGRMAELEREVALIREVLGEAEHTTPGVRGRRTACGKRARGLFFPQDRDVLAGFDDALCERLNGELDIIAETTADQGRAGKRAFTAERMEWRRLGTTSLNAKAVGWIR